MGANISNIKRDDLTQEDLNKLSVCMLNNRNIYTDIQNGKVYWKDNGSIIELHFNNKSNKYDRIVMRNTYGYEVVYLHSWVYYNATGVLPDNSVIHHLNLKKTDNRIINLLCCANNRIHASLHYLYTKVRDRQLLVEYLVSNYHLKVFDDLALKHLQDLVDRGLI